MPSRYRRRLRSFFGSLAVAFVAAVFCGAACAPAAEAPCANLDGSARPDGSYPDAPPND